MGRMALMGRRMRPKLNGRHLAVVLVSSSFSSAIQAATLDYGIDVGIGETNNVTLVPTDRVSQTIAATDFDFAIKQQSSRLDLNAKGDFSYLDYLQNAYSSQFVGRFDGTAQYSLIPERLTWTLQDGFGQSQLNPFTAVTPTNQEHVNYASTGPNLYLRMGPLGFLDATLRFSRADYQTSPFDSNRFSGSLAAGRQLSANSSVSIDGSFERVLFDNTVVNTDFDRSSVYAHYELQGSRTTLAANLGVTRVNQAASTITGPLAKLELSRQISAAAKLTFTVGRDVTDASSSFSGNDGIGGASGLTGITQAGSLGANNTLPGSSPTGIGTTPAAATSVNYTVTYATVGWEYVRNRTTFRLSGRWEKDSYDGLPQLDVDRGDGEFAVERKLTRALSAEISGSLLRTDYSDANFGETYGRVGGGLTFRAGRGLEIRLRYDHTSRIVSGTDSGTGYAEDRAFLTIGYRPDPKSPTT
jgi:hypothetical protein